MAPRLRVLALAFLLLVCCTGAARGATFTVTTFNDLPDVAINGVCATALSTAPCSLRAAIQEANAKPDADTIVLPAGPYGLGNGGSDEDAAATGDLDITSPVTIAGAGATVTEVQQGTADRLFDVGAGGSLTISDVRLDDGFLADDVSSGAGDGAGIRSVGTLVARRVWFSDMTATVDSARNGGAVAIDGGTGTVADSLFTGMRVANGAGQAAAVVAGKLTLQNVTATGNVDEANGGVFHASGGTLVVLGATVVGNTAAAVDVAAPGAATVSSTLAGGPLGPCTTDSAAAVKLGPGNVFDRTTPCSDGADAAPRLYGAGGNPKVSALQSAGGTLPSVLVPLAGSPAIDTGAACGVLTVDGRGGPRPQGASCDAGAVEAGSLGDVRITGTGPATVEATDTVSDTFLVVNAGSDPARGVAVTLTPSGPGALLTLTTTKGSCTLATGRCALGDLAPGQQVLVRGDLRAGLSGALRTTLHATHVNTERVTANDEATVTTTVHRDISAPRVRLAAATVRVGTHRTATFRLGCPATERHCTGSVRPTFRGKHLRSVRVNLVGGRSVTIRVALNAAARRSLRHGSKLRLTLAVNVVDASGNRFRSSLRGTIRK
jgi:hypothetical protein